MTSPEKLATPDSVMAKFENVLALIKSGNKAPEAIADFRAEVTRLATQSDAPEDDKNYPFHELKFIMRVLGHKGRAPEQDWETAYGMARDIRIRWHKDRLATQRQGEGDGWQPIETAPKDGRTLLLGYFNSHGKWRTLRGQWFSEAHINDNWEEECEEGWYETSVECGDDVNCWKTEPTHFDFLPPAPPADGGVKP